MNIRRIIFFPALAVAFLFAACASNKIDWGNRVGNYTYDQAIVEMGPPDKMAMLSDNSKVAQWYGTRRTGMSLGVGTGVGPVGAGVGVPVGSGQVRVLRLTFGPDGVLKSWSR